MMIIPSQIDPTQWGLEPSLYFDGLRLLYLLLQILEIMKIIASLTGLTGLTGDDKITLITKYIKYIYKSTIIYFTNTISDRERQNIVYQAFKKTEVSPVI